MSEALNIKNDKIPVGWKKVLLPDFTRIVMGQSPSSDTYNYEGEGLPFFQGKAEFGELYPRIEKYCSAPKKIADEGAVLLSVRAPVGPTNLAQVKSCIGRGLAAIHPADGMSSKFLLLLLRSIEADLSSKGTGSTFKAITKKFVEEMEFAIPPIHEQERIVEKVEELLSELDEGIESLKTARAQLKTYRQAALKHAFEGKLTEQWRKDNADKLESPEQLLARIQQERQARYQQQLEEWKQAVKEWEASGKYGKKPTKPKVFKGLPLPSPIDTNLPSIPDNWLWVHPEHLASSESYSIGIGPFGSNLKVVDYRTFGIPLIFVRNITRQNFVDDLKYVSSEKAEELYAHQVKPLDLLITKMGDPPGDCEIYPENSPVAVLTADCLKFRLFSGYFDRKFYKHCINSNLIRKQLGLITKGVAQKKISVDRFKTLNLPLPSLEEQRIIASEIDRVLEKTEKTEKELLRQIEKIEILRQAILKKAFSGQLLKFH